MIKKGQQLTNCFLIAGVVLGGYSLFVSDPARAQSVEPDLEKEVRLPLPRTPDGGLLVENFESTQVGELPTGWYNRDFTVQITSPEESFKYRYKVVEENGNRYLHYEDTDAHHMNFPLGRRLNLHLEQTPVLSWKWRVNKLPENASEADDKRNDVAASIYVVFDMGKVAFFKKVPKSIRYTWSSTLPKGHESSVFFGNQKIVVVESGEEHLGRWKTFRRNIAEDYRRLFGEEPPERPLAILILSDGNSTGSIADAAYDDIIFYPASIID